MHQSFAVRQPTNDSNQPYSDGDATKDLFASTSQLRFLLSHQDIKLEQLEAMQLQSRAALDQIKASVDFEQTQQFHQT